MARTKLQIIDGEKLQIWQSSNTTVHQIWNNAGALDFDINTANKWKITAAGILQSTGAQTIQSSAGTLTIQPGNNVVFCTSAGSVGIRTASPSTFALQIDGDTGPNSDILYNFGSASLRWNSAYIYGGFFYNQINADFLTASKVIFTDASKNLTSTGTVGVTEGGTGLATCSQGDLFYGSAANTVSTLAKNATSTRYLSNTGTSNNPAWAQVDLSNGVTGTLTVGGGGTGSTSFTEGSIIFSNGTILTQDNANLFWFDSGNQLRLGLISSSSELLSCGNSSAITTGNSIVNIINSRTSSTASIEKTGILTTCNGSWSGSNSSVIGISSNCSGGTINNFCFRAESTDASSATNTRGFFANISSNSTTNYGLYVSVDSGTTNYGIYVNAGDCYFGPSTNKIGFFGATTVVRTAAYTQTYATASRTMPNLTSTAVTTTAATNVAPYGYLTAAQADDIITQINNLRTDVDNAKKVINQILDDAQAYGLLQ